MALDCFQFPFNIKSSIKVAHPQFVVPNAAAAVLLELGVVALLASGRTRVVPDLLVHLTHQADRQTHAIRTTHTTDTVQVVRLVIGQGDLNNERYALDVDTSSGHIGADQKVHLLSLERLQVRRTFLRPAIGVQADTRVRVLVRLHRLASQVQVGLQVVAVDLRTAEDDRLIDLQTVDRLDDQVALEYFRRLTVGLRRRIVRLEGVSVVHAIRLNLRSLRILPVARLAGVHTQHDVMDRVRHRVLRGSREDSK